MKRMVVITAALFTLANVSVITATASSASSSGGACVFDAPNAVLTLGHVGWGFELPSGNWEFGANEGPVKAPTNWTSKTWSLTGSAATMLATFRKGGPYAGNYTQYKCVTVRAFNASAAEQQVNNEQHEQYLIPTRDCESQAYNVLAKYGVKNLPNDIADPVPNNWFGWLFLAGFPNPTRL